MKKVDLNKKEKNIFFFIDFIFAFFYGLLIKFLFKFLFKFVKSKLYGYLFVKKWEIITKNDYSRYPKNIDIGQMIIYGDMYFDGKKFNFKNFKDVNKDLDKNTKVFLWSFEWLKYLKDVDTIKARNRAIDLISSFITCYLKDYNETFEIGILSRRIYNIVINYDFLKIKKDVILMDKLNDFLINQVDYLIKIKPLCNKKDYFVLNETLIMISLFFKNKENLLNIGVNGIIKELSIIILPDGGHYLSDPLQTLLILERILILYNNLKFNKIKPPQELNIYIDNMITFIKTLRTLDNSLAVFNGGVEVASDFIDYLFSLNGVINPNPSNQLKYSGYLRVQNKETLFIMDTGNSKSLYNSLFSNEINMKNSKIIVNNGLKQDRVNHSGLVLFGKYNEVFFNKKDETSVKITQRKDENWETYVNTYFDYNILTYHKTVMIDRHSGDNILVEELIRIEDKYKEDIVDAYIRLNLHPKIVNVKTTENKNIILINVNDNVIVFRSDKELILDTGFYYGILNEKIKNYVIKIPIDLRQKVLKLEWGLNVVNN
jgi:uncharacterized heparinase superfamily protein